MKWSHIITININHIITIINQLKIERYKKLKKKLIGGLNPPEKYESQIGSSCQLLVKIINVQNHQPDYSGYLTVRHRKWPIYRWFSQL